MSESGGSFDSGDDDPVNPYRAPREVYCVGGVLHGSRRNFWFPGRHLHMPLAFAYGFFGYDAYERSPRGTHLRWVGRVMPRRTLSRRQRRAVRDKRAA